MSRVVSHFRARNRQLRKHQSPMVYNYDFVPKKRSADQLVWEPIHLLDVRARTVDGRFLRVRFNTTIARDAWLRNYRAKQ